MTDPSMPSEPLRIYVGYDPEEDIAFRVCRHSIERHATKPVSVVPIDAEELRERGVYRRDKDPLASTAFTYTRFLTPWLAGYAGWALFCDCDTLFTADVAELFALAQGDKAVHCVHHDHRPTETEKMGGKIQTVYPRKNWSSVVLYNCGHPANRVLTPDVVNSQTGAYLHRFLWLDDDLIGELPEEWNWLEGSSPQKPTVPKLIHFTRGGPWFDLDHEIAYGDLWNAERDAMLSAERAAPPR